MTRPKNDDMRIVALTKRIHEVLGEHAVALGLASLVVRKRDASAIKMVEAIDVEWIDLWPGVGG